MQQIAFVARHVARPQNPQQHAKQACIDEAKRF